MKGEITSPRADQALAPTILGQWGALAAFLKHPYLPRSTLRTGLSARLLARLFLLDLLAIIAFGTIILTVASFGIEFPENLNSTLGLDPQTVLLLVIVAPILEEIAFRSWLSGRPGILFALLWAGAGTILEEIAFRSWLSGRPGILFALLWAGAGIAGLTILGSGAGFAGPFVALAGLVVAVMMLVALRGRPPLPIFERHFAYFFWASAVLFAAVHLANYEEGALAILLPLLVPQFVVGTLAGYIRVQCGLIWSIALHAAHNALAVSLALMALALGAEA